MYRLFLLCIIPIFFACSPKPQVDAPAVADQQPAFRLVDSTYASEAILIDTSDRFFELVRPLEMSIQMKKQYPEGTTRETILEDYRDFLRTEVSSFTVEEKIRVQAVMEQAKAACDSLHPDIFPYGLQLIKVKTNHYGPSVYYTRENRIMIPTDVLENFNPEGFLSVMLHEIFHIYSRYHPEIREKLYNLVGYYPLESVQINDELAPLMFFNPDGVSYHWAIDLKIGDELIPAVPIISSNEPAFRPEKSAFFAYLDFGMHRLEPGSSNAYVIGENLGARAMGPLFERITQNTQYIIHPDEVLADNFMYLTYPFEPGNEPVFSEKGQLLLEQIETTLRQQ